MFALFFLIVATCTVGLISVASLIQQRDHELQRLAARTLHSSSPQTAGPGLRGHQTALMQHLPDADADEDDRASSIAAALESTAPVESFAQYECVGWRAQRDCAPDGGEDPENDRPCNATVHFGESGFCELRHKDTGALRRVMNMHCNSLRNEVHFRCDEFPTLLSYGAQALTYQHDANFSFDDCRHQLTRDQLPATNAAGVAVAVSAAVKPASFARGVVIVVYDAMLESVYASVRSLRSLGCSLPVELWYKASETDPSHPLLQALTTQYGAFLREIRDPRAAKFYTKTHAVFYSAFDSVLLLDADNFAARDPTYLFETPEFETTGAIFWPDFWRPSKTIFNIQPTSFVWDVLGLQPVDMFEQESGQVLINRQKHQKALNALLYYASNPGVLERMRLVWGDKDLFRFAWMKTQSSFHMIETPPGSAGLKLPDKNIFCGVTMVQHDPTRQIIFLHRNQEKLSSANRAHVWMHVQDFRMDEVPLQQYDVRGANGGRYFPQFKRCYGKDIYYEQSFTVTPVAELPFAALEQQLLDFVQEAAVITGKVEREADLGVEAEAQQ